MNGNPESRRTKIMVRKKYHFVLLLGLILLSQGCGTNDASFDAVVVGPGDIAALTTGNLAGVGAIDPPIPFSSTGPLVFKVQRSANDPTPVANANVRIDVGNGSNVITLLLNSSGTSCYSGSNPDTNSDGVLSLAEVLAAPPDCFSVNTQTDNLGVVQFKILGEVVAGCGAGTSAITSFANAQVTSSASFAVSNIPITITCS